VEGLARGPGRVRARFAPPKALAAQSAGEFGAEISPVTVREDAPDLAKRRRSSRAPRRSTVTRVRAADIPVAEGLAKLRPVFAAKGSVTAGNSSQMSDGAGA
jgi:acetyl-CoA acyltransferase